MESVKLHIKVPNAKRVLICLTVLLVICEASVWLSDSESGSRVHARKRRQFGGSSVCQLRVIKCATRPPLDGVCDVGEWCVDVLKIRVSFFPLEYSCNYVCEPTPTTTGLTISQNTTDTPMLWENSALSQIVSVPWQNGTSTEWPQNTSDVSQTTGSPLQNTPPKSSPDNVTTTDKPPKTNVNWRDNPSHCSADDYCENDGNCTMIAGIPWCTCTAEWRGTRCADPCSLQCYNGSCVHLNGTQSCSCVAGYDPDTNCEKLIPDPVPLVQEAPEDNFWYIYVIAFFVLLVAILVAYVVLKRLRGRSLLVTKMFHFFQPYEDDDEKLFDVFISFKSSNRDFSQSPDEQFVIRTLHPKLENQLHFNVCVHYRDFSPGDTIANNIMWAVENSRRTILVLSPLYIESEWARLEYQKAQQEMLQLRHKIIPIILEGISGIEIEDPNLKHILSSVTYIEYPGISDQKQENKFWEMLELALPKKRSREQSNATDNSSRSSRILMPQESVMTDITDISIDSAIGPKEIIENHFRNTNKMNSKTNSSSHNGLEITRDEREKTIIENANNLTRIPEDEMICTHL